MLMHEGGMEIRMRKGLSCKKQEAPADKIQFVVVRVGRNYRYVGTGW